MVQYLVLISKKYIPFKWINGKLYWNSYNNTMYQSAELLLMYNMLPVDWTAFLMWQVHFKYHQEITSFIFNSE